MHLTRIWPDPRNAQARRDLSDAYEMHRTLSRAFASGDEHGQPRFLWRLESGPSWSNPSIIVQSKTSMGTEVFDSAPTYLKKPVESKEVDEMALIQIGRRYRFRLLANPTVTRDGKRHGLRKDDEQLAWLERQGGRHGFSVDAAVPSTSGRLEGRKGSERIIVQQVCFDGILRAADAHRLASVLTVGIGPAKAFGCGLLSVTKY